MSKEEAINKLYATIKTKFENDGIMQELRCMLQSKMVAMMKGKSEMSNGAIATAAAHHSYYNALANGQDIAVATAAAGDVSDMATCATVAQRDARIQMLHQLILDYLHWHGFEYTAEMFAIESSTVNVKPMRELLEAQLGTFKHKSIPILLELIADLMERNQ